MKLELGPVDSVGNYALDKDARQVREAEKAGYKVVTGTPSTLLLDLDNVAAVNQYFKISEMLDEKNPDLIQEEEGWKSKSGNIHMVLKLGQALDLLDRLFLQQLLGSDPKKGFLDAYRMQLGLTEPCRLFQPPGAEVKTGTSLYDLLADYTRAT